MIRSITLFLAAYLCFPFFANAQVPVPDFTADPVAGCSPLIVSFTDKSTGSPTSWSWDFGNGATSALKNPSTTYFIPGTYTVSLTTTNADGSKTLTRTNYITVYGNPSVAFSVPDSIGCYPFPAQFTDATTASPGTVNTSWVWDLGDGTQSSSQNPKNTYLNNGSYTVSLKVTNDKGCWGVATKQNYIKIDGGIKADFNFQQPASCSPPFELSFSNASTGSGQLSYTWQFGDGGTSTDVNPIYTYNNAGVYSVTLITQSSEGCSDTLRKENLLNLGSTTTSFTIPERVCANDTVPFTNTSSAAATSLLWDFGDGSTATSTNPVKVFSTAGTYTVRLLQQYGACADSFSKTIVVSPRPTANFTVDKSGDCQLPLQVNFTNTSTDAVSYQWNFGDSTTSTDANPSHTYTTYGNFDVTLIATNALGCTDTLRLPGAVNLRKPSIRFTSLPVKGCIPYPASFNAAIDSPDPVLSYLWDFGNGITSSAVNPSYTYTEQGTYTVTLAIITAKGCTDTLVMPQAVRVGTKPEVNFHALPTQVCAFQSVQFMGETQNANSWSWSFGDGGASSQQNPIHQFTDTGTFDIQLIAENNGCRDSMQINDYITVKPPISSFDYQTTCSDRLVYSFINKSVGATTVQWDFGDGTTSTQLNPTHTFLGLGTYTVRLTVTNDTCSHVSTAVIKIVNPTPDFTALPPVACKGAPVSFKAESANADNLVSYAWNFGNGSNGSGINASTVYTQAGIYTVSLTVKDINGCVDSVVKKQAIQIHGPTAGFKAQNNIGCRGLQASFSDASTDDGRSKITRWQWNLGDGTVLNHTSPVTVKHVYGKAGSYTVSLTVTDAGGCTDSLVLPALVQVADVNADFVSADTLSCPGAVVRFTNTSRAPTAYTSLWSFGDGTVSTEQQPTASYKADSIYTVKLKITDAAGCTDSVEKVAYVSIRRPVASFRVNDTASLCIPFQVQYTNTSTNYIQHVWDLGGGTSQLKNPTQYYNTPGVYETTLVVTGPGGCTDTATQKISVFDAVTSRLSYLPLSGCKPLTVDMTALSSSKMDAIWDFGDGTIISSKDSLLQQHTYQSFGDFIPKLIVKNNSGCVAAITGLDTIQIKGATAKFGADNRLFCDIGLVNFSDSTTFNTPVKAYHWNFGDGNTSSQSSPSHQYQQPGIYQVSLDVQTENNCRDTFQLQYPIKVVASPAIRIGGDSVICAGESITHLGLFERNDTSIVRWSWAFPNGNKAAIRMPQQQVYKEAGTFTVQSIATNSTGCMDTAYRNIYINPIPTVTLPTTITTMVATPVLLPAVYSDQVKSYQWTVPDGLSCTTCAQPMAMPRFDTKYTVRFQDQNGCYNEGTVQVKVLCNNDNVFVPNTFSPNGDGSNDVFYVRGKGLSRVKTLRVFNRWGQVVFEKVNFNVNDAAMGWDGTFKGAKPVPDVYVYQVEIYCDNSQVVKFEGNVALIQ